MSTRRARVARGAFSTASMTLLSNLTGFLRQLAFAWVYGAGRAMDAYLVASILSQMVFSSVDSAISALLIPVYTELKQKSQEDAELFLRAMSGLVTAVTALAGLLLYLLAPLLVHLLAPGFGPGEAGLASGLLRVMMPSLVFMGLSSVSAGFLQTKGAFGPAAAMFIPRNIALIVLAAWLGHSYGISVLAWGSLLGAMLQLYLVARPLRRLGSSLRLVWQPRHPGIHTMLIRLPGVFVNFFMYSAALIVDRILASGLPAGMISALNYAQLLVNFPIQMLTSLAIAVFPTLSELAAAHAGPELSRAVRMSLRLLVFLVAPISLFTIFFREPLVAVVYAHGAFGLAALKSTSYALLFFSIGMASVALNSLLGRVIFALGETRVLFTSAAWGVGVTIMADLILIHPMQQGGLALGTSMGSWASTVVLLRVVALHLERFSARRILADALYSSLLAAISFGAVFFAYLRLHGGVLPHGLLHLALFLALTFLAGAALYLLLQRLFGRRRIAWQRVVREGLRGLGR